MLALTQGPWAWAFRGGPPARALGARTFFYLRAKCPGCCASDLLPPPLMRSAAGLMDGWFF